MWKLIFIAMVSTYGAGVERIKRLPSKDACEAQAIIDRPTIKAAAERQAKMGLPEGYVYHLCLAVEP